MLFFFIKKKKKIDLMINKGFFAGLKYLFPN